MTKQTDGEMSPLKQVFSATAIGAGVLLTGWLGIWLIGWLIFGPVTSTGRYEGIIAEHRHVFPHFPERIDPQAEQVEFQYVPQFGMGGPILWLRMKLPESRVHERLEGMKVEGFREATTENRKDYETFLPISMSGSDRNRAWEEINGSRLFLFGGHWLDTDYVRYVGIDPARKEILYYGTIAR
ncbi:MAG: hypothetical protein AAGK14_03890 [Verrucomicrobiota bacterium]